VAITDEAGNHAKSKNVCLAIHQNEPPKIKIRHDPALSYTGFNVYFDGTTTGASYNEENDYLAHIEAELIGPDEKEYHASRNFGENERLKPLNFVPDAKGVYKLYASVTDSHGATASLAKPLEIGVQKGATGKDWPVIYAPSCVDCLPNQTCKLDASETVIRDRDVYVKFTNAAGITLANVNKNPCCCGGVCHHNFTASDTAQVVAYYIDDDGDPYHAISEEIAVHVTDPNAPKTNATINSTTAAGTTNATRPTPKATPSDGIPLFAAIILAFGLSRARH